MIDRLMAAWLAEVPHPMAWARSHCAPSEWRTAKWPASDRPFRLVWAHAAAHVAGGLA
jgi:hypothetical protein